MKLIELKKKCRTLNIINTIIVILIIIASAISILMTIQSGLDSDTYIFAIISLVLGFVALIIGRFLPSKEANVYMSSKQKAGMAAANLILNKKMVSPSVLKEGPIVRSWNFLAFLIISVFMALLTGMGAMLCYFTNAKLAAVAYAAAALLWLSLLPFCWFWTYYDSCVEEIEEHGESFEDLGKKILHQIKCGSIAFALIVGIPFLIDSVNGILAYKNTPTFNTRKITKQLQNVNKKLEDIKSQDFYPSPEYDTLDEALADIRNSHDNKTMYYRIQNVQENVVYIATWNDESDDVFVDTFNVIENDRLKRSTSFVSSSLKKSELQGQETGILEEKQ